MASGRFPAGQRLDNESGCWESIPSGKVVQRTGCSVQRRSVTKFRGPVGGIRGKPLDRKDITRRISASHGPGEGDGAVKMGNTGVHRRRTEMVRPRGFKIVGNQCTRNGRGGNIVQSTSAPQKSKRRVSAGNRPSRGQCRTSRENIQDGDFDSSALICTRKTVGIGYRPKRRLLPRTYPSGFPKVSGDNCKWDYLSVQDSELRVVSSSVDFYEDHQAGDDHPKRKRDRLLLLYRRLHRLRRLRGSSKWLHERGDCSIVRAIRIDNQPGEGSIKGITKAGIPWSHDRFKQGTYINSRSKGKVNKGETGSGYKELSKRKKRLVTPERRQYCRNIGGLGRSSYIGTSIFEVCAAVNKRRKRPRFTVVSQCSIKRRGHRGSSVLKRCNKRKQWPIVKGVSKNVSFIRGCQYICMGSIPTRGRLGGRQMDRGSGCLAYKFKGIKSSKLGHRVFQMARKTRKRGPINDGFYGGVLLYTQRRGACKKPQSSSKRDNVTRDKYRYKARNTNMDTYGSKPSGLSLKVGRPRRLVGIKNLFQKDIRRMELKRRRHGGSFRGLDKQTGNPVQQLSVLSGYRSSRCILPRLGGEFYSYKLARSSLKADPKNPFLLKRMPCSRYNSGPKVGGSTLVASANEYDDKGASRTEARRLVNGTIRTDGTLLKSLMGNLNLPSKWFLMTPRQVRQARTLGLEEGDTLINVSLDGLIQFALNRGIQAYAAAVQSFVDYSKDNNLDPDDLLQAKQCARGFLHTGLRGELLLAVRVAYSVTKIWDVNPIEEALIEEQLGLLQGPENLDRLISLGRSEATLKIYQREWDDYYRFTVLNNLDMRFPEALSKYLVHLWLEGLIGKALSVIYSIKRGSLMLGWKESPSDSFMVQEAKRALNKLKAKNSNEFKREPLPAKVLVEFVLKVWEEGLSDNIYFIRCCAVLLTGFRLMLRSKSLAGIRVCDLSFKDWGVEVAIAPVKTMNSWQRKHIETSMDHRVCPVYWLKRLADYHRENTTTLIFAGFDGKPLSSAELTGIVRKAAKIAGVTGEYSSHSLRIGGATAAAIGGLYVTTIQAIGGWESLAVLRYIRSIVGVKKKATERMGLVVDRSTSIPLL